MKILKFVIIAFIMLSIVSCSSKNEKMEEVVDIINKVNKYWQNNNSYQTNSFWHHAAYHTGNMEVYKVLKNEEFLKFTTNWAEHNEWKGAKSDDKANWRYSYGESDDYVLFGDFQICFQTYADLYNLEPAEYKIARAKEVMEYQMNSDKNDYWWWSDGLYMVMPVMTKLYNITENPLYLEKLYEYWEYANYIMYDEKEALYFRDAKYIYPKHKTPNDLKDFWSRGNGWVFAGFAKVLEDLPQNDAHRDTYITYYKNMAKKLSELQLEEGYWSRSLMDPDYASGYETSGTAFFTYGFLWGVNNGYLDKNEYKETIDKAWKYLTEIALQEDGKVGYVQPIGENASQHKVDADTTADFGVGAFLLAASEMYRYLEKRN